MMTDMIAAMMATWKVSRSARRSRPRRAGRSTSNCEIEGDEALHPDEELFDQWLVQAEARAFRCEDLFRDVSAIGAELELDDVAGNYRR